MIKELIKIKENNNIVSIFCDEDDTSMFLEGYIYAIGRQDFLGGIRSIIPGRNILIDHSFSGALEKEYEEFTFKGGVTGE